MPVADQVAQLVELGLGFNANDALAAVQQSGRYIGGQHRAVLHHLPQHRDQRTAIVLGQHAQQAAKRQALGGAETQHAQRLG